MSIKKSDGSIVVDNPWNALKVYTPARIALGRTGTSLPTKPHLEFQLAHARARKAVHHELDVPALAQALKQRGHDAHVLNSAAANRLIYLQRPDMGRRLDDVSRAALQSLPKSQQTHDVAFVIGDGLSALAIEENATAFLDFMLPKLTGSGWRIAPLAVVKGARVAVGDEIGEILGSDMVVILIGERPGLSSPDSMGIYMTFKPRTGLTDESRNCISNVRKEGLSYEAAAHKLHYLMTEARRRQTSGVHLKDEAETLAQVAAPASADFLTNGNRP